MSLSRPVVDTDGDAGRRVDAAVVRILNGAAWIGTGFVVGQDLVLTCGHVVYDHQVGDLRLGVALAGGAGELHIVGVADKLGRWVPPGDDGVTGDGDDDWALLRSEQPLAVAPLPLLRGVTPALLQAWAGKLQVQGRTGVRGQAVCAQGLTAGGAKWAEVPAGTLRSAQLEGGIPAGLSGAPVLIDADGVLLVVGMLVLGKSGAPTSFFHGSDVLLAQTAARGHQLARQLEPPRQDVAAADSPYRHWLRRWGMWLSATALLVGALAFIVAERKQVAVELQRVEHALDVADCKAAREALAGVERAAWLPVRERTVVDRLCALIQDPPADSQRYDEEWAGLLVLAQRQGRDWGAYVQALRGARELYAGRLRGAAAAYQSALQRRPRLLEASLGLSTIALWEGDYARGEQILNTALRFAPGSPLLRSARAWLLVRRGDLVAARAAYRELVRDDPNVAQAYLERAWVEWMGGDMRSALASLQAAERLFVGRDAKGSLGMRPWIYQVRSVRLAEQVGMTEAPALLVFASPLRKRHIFWLMLAVSACGLEQETDLQWALEQAAALRGQGLVWSDVQRSLVMIADAVFSQPRLRACVQQVSAQAGAAFR